MEAKMTIKTRKEILFCIRNRYNQASWSDKKKILDELVATTLYRRKYAIYLLNHKKDNSSITSIVSSQGKSSKYGEELKQELIKIWYAANKICSKRLVPFLPCLLNSLERFNHISLSNEMRNLILKISPATVDRILKQERISSGKHGLSTTCAGALLKNQIKVRTFADWNDIVPGFFEGDLVAHCGTKTNGCYLNSLVITDIASTWTEFYALIRKSEEEVIRALLLAQETLPFPILGLDTDNGSEFINYGLLEFCQKNHITFTRSRAYKKNDQAHIEEKNGSIIRRIVGYDRYEGIIAYNALECLYKVLRLYVNFFQPSLKLISRTRDGAKVTKKYDKAKTPYQRIMNSPQVLEEIKSKLKNEFESLDPVFLLAELKKLQNIFWEHAWNKSENNIHEVTKAVIIEENLIKKHASYRKRVRPIRPKIEGIQLGRKKIFSSVWNIVIKELEQDPKASAKSIVKKLIKSYPEFNLNQVRTMRRNIAKWKAQGK
jgi:hypothetical protein